MVTTLTVAFDDTLDVHRDPDHRIGQIVLMSGGWAAYTANWQGAIQQERVGTYPDVASAVEALSCLPVA